MSIEKRIDHLVKEFSLIESWEDRYRLIIAKGRKLPELSPEFCTDEFRVKGCMSQVWLMGELKEEKVFFKGSSDAEIVRGLVALFLEIYSKATPQEILNTKPTFLDALGLRENLSLTRANGVMALLKQIIHYAYAFQTKLNQEYV